MTARQEVGLWMAGAALAAFLVAAGTVAAFGSDGRGLAIALQATARLMFLAFWPAYVGGALAQIFGPRFDFLRRRGRELGLAFASALFIHLLLVGWLSLAGYAPSIQTFIVFGIAAAFAYALLLFSLPALKRRLGPWGWLVLRSVAMNYIAAAFALDFLRVPAFDTAKHIVGYLPFALLSIAGPMLYLLALLSKGTALARAKGGRP